MKTIEEIIKKASELAKIRYSRKCNYSKCMLGYFEEIKATLEYYKEDLTTHDQLKKTMLNGASSRSEYSRGGCSLVYNSDLREHLFCPSIAKKMNESNQCYVYGSHLLDIQARRLEKISSLFLYAYKLLENN